MEGKNLANPFHAFIILPDVNNILVAFTEKTFRCLACSFTTVKHNTAQTVILTFNAHDFLKAALHFFNDGFVFISFHRLINSKKYESADFLFMNQSVEKNRILKVFKKTDEADVIILLVGCSMNTAQDF